MEQGSVLQSSRKVGPDVWVFRRSEKEPQWSTHLSQEWRWQRDQLRSGASGVGEIALAIGFQSSSAFTIAFTRIVGCPPTQFLLKDQEDFSLKKLRRKQYLGYRFGHRRQVTLNYGGKGFSWFVNYALLIIGLRYSGNSKSVEGNFMGVQLPSRHHCKLIILVSYKHVWVACARS
jgi:hypothetical protein